MELLLLVSSLWVLPVQAEIYLGSHSGHLFYAATESYSVGKLFPFKAYTEYV